MPFLTKKSAKSIPLTPLTKDTLESWLKKQGKARRNWSRGGGVYRFARRLADDCADRNGAVEQVLFGLKNNGGLYSYAGLPARLSPNTGGYYIDQKMSKEHATQAALGWALGSYQFNRYKSGEKKALAQLVWPAEADKKIVQSTTTAVYLVRDLVNTPANDMGPAELARRRQRKLAGAFNNTTVIIIVGEELLKKNYPAVYEVGKGSPRAPRFIDFRWGNKKNPAVTLQLVKGFALIPAGLI